jgi:hypothetical protein
MNIDAGTIIVAAITALPATLLALATLIQSFRNAKKIDAVQVSTDGMKEELVKVTRSDALQEGHEAGVKAGVKQEKADARGRAPNEP